METKALGRHLIVELVGCNPRKLDDLEYVSQILKEAAIYANATVVDTSFHKFNPYGISGVVVVAESHIAIHTWPEYGYASLDVYTCGDETMPKRAAEFLKEAFEAKEATCQELVRGEVSFISKYSPKVRP